MQQSFSKYSGCGNDFVLINNLSGHFPTHDSNLIRRLCHRQLGIGADGIILLDQHQDADFRMRIFNSDGTEAEMCGNGLRCLMKFIQELGFNATQYSIETMHRRLVVRMKSAHVEMQMGPPKDIKWDINVPVDSQNYQIDYIDTGVPHAILFVNNIEEVDVALLGPKFRNHEIFGAKGANMNFVQAIGQDRIRLRTFERGVEKETLACGTGAAAAAIAAVRKFKMNLPVKVDFQSGDTVEMDYREHAGQIEDMIQIGPAEKIFHGVVSLP